MSSTRRGFLAAGIAGAAQVAAQGPGAEMPRVRFGRVEISRLILGVNPFYGYAHFNGSYSATMRDWYTQERVVDVLRRCERAGVNAYNYVHASRAQPDWERFLSEGGKMHLIAQATADDPTEMVRAVKPYGVWVQGERADDAYRAGKMSAVRDYCKKLRDLGVSVVGLGSHIPEVLAIAEDGGWDVDFYAGCVYNRRRTADELKKLLGGEVPEMPTEVYLQADPPRMYKFFQQTAKPCCAFKILAAGRIRNIEAAFKLAFASIKPIDFVCVGMFPYNRDEVAENARWTVRYGSQGVSL